MHDDVSVDDVSVDVYIWANTEKKEANKIQITYIFHKPYTIKQWYERQTN